MNVSLHARRCLWLICVCVSALSPASAQFGILGPETYPTGINPLTGLPAPAEALNRRPLLVKISNYPALVRSEQLGLNQADLVWETLLAGGVTRFSAFFLSQDLDKVGPIRSGRLVDFELVRMYRALFAYSGMAQGTLDVLRTDGLVSSRSLGGNGPCPPLCYYPQEGIAQEHTLFADTQGLRALAVERERDVTPEALYGMAFSAAVPTGGTPLQQVDIGYAEQTSSWAYDEASGQWLRSTDGEAHFDAEGLRISADNVLIVEEIHTIQPYVSENYWGPGNFAFSVNFIGEGRAVLLRDGQRWEGTWQRASREDPIRFFDGAGRDLLLKPGRSFINLVPRWIDGYELQFIPPQPPQVVVNGDTGVNMQFGPSPQYVTPDVAYPNDSFSAIGRNWDGQWVQVLRLGERRAVWLPLERLDIGELDVMTLPLARPTNERG